MPKFQIIDSFAIESRCLFVLAGSITEGNIKTGMLVRIPFNTALSMTAPIESIEFLRREGGREDTALCIKCQNADELEMWSGLNIGDEAVDVIEAEPPR